MKKLLVTLAAVLALTGLHAAEASWLTDFSKAQTLAAKEKKLVLLNFTGSDWCGGCILLHQQVFSQPAFIAYAKTNLVLVEVDFPVRKKQSEAQIKANEALSEKYGIEGYPTIIVLNSEGKRVGELGYQPGGPTAFIAALEKLKQ